MSGQGTCGPFWRINGPLPEAPRYSLLGAARVVTDIDQAQIERWMNGVEVYPYPPGTAQAWDNGSTGSDVVDKATGGVISHPQFGAMTVYFAETCSTISVWGSDQSPEDAFVARATAAFTAVEAAALEREFMTGEVMLLNPFLADGQGTFPNLDAATTVVNGIGILENEIAKSGRSGVIHCSPGLVIAAAGQHLLDRDGPRLITTNGTPVVPGYGYAPQEADSADWNTPPTHSAPSGTEEWVFATGPVEVRRSDVILLPENLSQALDRTTNTITYRVERYYVVDWDTVVQAAVKIDRCMITC